MRSIARILNNSKAELRSIGFELMGDFVMLRG